MPISLTSFTPSTKIKSSEVNGNFTTIENFLEGLRPQIHISIPDLLSTGTNKAGELTIKTGNTLFFHSVALRVKTAPTGSALIINIKKNGSTIFSTKPEVAISATTGGSGAVFSSASLVDGDVLTFDIDQVGSTEPGRDLTISLAFFF